MRRIVSLLLLVLVCGRLAMFVARWMSRSEGTPTTSSAYLSRGMGAHQKGEYDHAIGDYNEAIRLDPNSAPAYYNRGAAWGQKQEYDKALADFDEAIRLEPKEARIYASRAWAWNKKGQFEKAVADDNEAIRLDPTNSDVFNTLAWLYATCPEASLRNGQRAVEAATKACELSEWKKENCLDTLAAAYAEAGDFDSAVKWETKALDGVPEQKRAAYQSRLNLYKDRQPWRDEPKQ
jgi:tetratricopeptide (TPR) repeat protein